MKTIVQRMNASKYAWLIYLVYIIAFVFSLKNDLNIFKHSTSIDFLYRVVGSRYMEDGKSPYFDKWHAADTDAVRYYHPIPRYSQKINGVTVTPAVLWLNQVFADMDFCKASAWWFWIQVGFLFLSGLLLLLSFANLWQKAIALAVFITFFAFSRNFYLHLHSSQVYVIYGFIFCLLYWLLRSNLRHKFLAIGVLITIAIWLKPFFVFLLIPFLIQRNKQFFKGVGIAAVVLLIQTLTFGQLHYWKEYSSAMKEYSSDIFQKNELEFLRIYAPSTPVADCIYPLKIPEQPTKSVGLVSMQYYFMRLGFKTSNTTIFGIAALVVSIAVSLLARKKRSPEQLIALLFLLYLLAELFTPALRMGYDLVQWSTAAVVVMCGYRNNKIAAVLMLAGLLINNGYSPIPQMYTGSIGELLMIAATFGFMMMPQRAKALDHSAE